MTTAKPAESGRPPLFGMQARVTLPKEVTLLHNDDFVNYYVGFNRPNMPSEKASIIEAGISYKRDPGGRGGPIQWRWFANIVLDKMPDSEKQWWLKNGERLGARFDDDKKTLVFGGALGARDSAVLRVEASPPRNGVSLVQFYIDGKPFGRPVRIKADAAQGLVPKYATGMEQPAPGRYRTEFRREVRWSEFTYLQRPPGGREVWAPWDQRKDSVTEHIGYGRVWHEFEGDGERVDFIRPSYGRVTTR